MNGSSDIWVSLNPLTPYKEAVVLIRCDRCVKWIIFPAFIPEDA